MADVVKRKRNYNASLRQEQAQMTRTRILDAASRLLTRGTYTGVTMEEIAQEAGVAYQTVYAVFGTKLQLAKQMIETGFHFEGVDELVATANASDDLEVMLRLGAEISRRINETCSDFVRFMRESGDADLLARYHWSENERLTQLTDVTAHLARTGRLRPDLSQAEALTVLWSMTGPDHYSRLVFEQGWTPSRYEEWLAAALISLLLAPADQLKQP